MAFQRPTLAEIADRVRSDFVSRLSLTGAVLRRSVIYALSLVIAGAAHLLHGHLDFLALQMFADTAEGEFLVRIANLFGIYRKAAQFASGSTTVTAPDGTVIPNQTRFIRSDGREYKSTADATVPHLGTTVDAPVIALIAGADGNADPATGLNFETPIAGASVATVVTAGGLVNGSDEETIEELRVRVIDRMRSPPHGGDAADYIAWALEVAGVTRAWVYPLELGAGSVVVRFVRDDDVSLIPDAGEVAAVQAHLDAVRPVTAYVLAVAPVADAVAFTLHIVPDTTATRAAVSAELADMIRRDASPGATILASHIETAIGSAEGITDFTVTVPAGNSAHALNHIATMGAITWT